MSQPKIQWYDRVFEYPPSESKFWTQRVREVRGACGMIPVGTGDLFVACANAGATMLGFDSDPDMVEFAASKARQLSSQIRDRVTLRVGNLEEILPITTKLSAVFVPRNGWWCLDDDRSRRRALDALGQSLVSGGQLIIDGFHVTDNERTHGDRTIKMPHVRRTAVPGHRRPGTVVTSVLYRGNYLRREAYALESVGRSHYLGTINLYCLPDWLMRHEIERSRLFRRVTLVGGWDGRPFDAADPSARQIWVLEKK